jgi:hypothetical protein
MIPAILNVLTSKLAGPIATAIAVSLAIALSVFAVQKAVLRRENTTLLNTVGQLNGSLDFQNRMVSDLGTKTAASQKLVRALQAASALAHAGDAAQAAALVAAPVETDLAKACAAADQHILENIK